MSLFGPTKQQLKLQEEARKRAAESEATYGKVGEERGAEEGDFYDYVAPFAGLGKALAKKGMKAAVGMAAKESADVAKKKGVRELMDKMPAPSNSKDPNADIPVDVGRYNRPKYDVVAEKPAAPKQSRIEGMVESGPKPKPTPPPKLKYTKQETPKDPEKVIDYSKLEKSKPQEPAWKRNMRK